MKKPRKTAQDRNLARIKRYTAGNRECAAIILADTERYGGPESLMVRWAHMVLDGYQRTPPADWEFVA